MIVKSDHDPLFVGYLFEFKSSYIASFTSPSPVPILSKGKFEEIKLFVSPDKDEQREIANDVREVASQTTETYAFYNNHYGAKAVVNAVQLEMLLGRPIPQPLPETLVKTFPDLLSTPEGSQTA